MVHVTSTSTAMAMNQSYGKPNHEVAWKRSVVVRPGVRGKSDRGDYFQ